MTTATGRKRILFVSLKRDAEPVLRQLRADGHEVSLVEDLDEARVLLGSGAFEQTILPAPALTRLLEEAALWSDADANGWRQSVYGLTHDLETLVQALRRVLGDASGPQGLDAVGGARRTLRVLSRYLEELTHDLGRPARQELRLRDLDLEDVTEAAAMTVYPSASEREQRLVIDIDEDVSTVRADATGLKRILCNLLEHASRQAPPLGTVTVRARRDDGNAVISIAYRRDRLSDRDLQGLFSAGLSDESLQGAWLVNVHRLVEAHGGRLWLESQKGDTCIYASLPAPARPRRERRPSHVRG